MRILSVIIVLLCLVFYSHGRALAPLDLHSGEARYTISGTLSDAGTGESLIGATVFVQELKTGSTSNLYGFYSVSLVPGDYTLVYSFVGYEPVIRQVNLSKNIRIDLALSAQAQQLGTEIGRASCRERV